MHIAAQSDPGEAATILTSEIIARLARLQKVPVDDLPEPERKRIRMGLVEIETESCLIGDQTKST